MHICWLSRIWNFIVHSSTHLRDKHGHLFLWYLELFWATFKVGQIKFENIHFCRLYRNWNFKGDLDTHFRDKHGHRFLLDLEIFCPSFKVIESKVEKMHFCRLSQNWNLNVDLGTYLIDKSASIVLGNFRSILDLSQTWSNKVLKCFTFSNLSELKF